MAFDKRCSPTAYREKLQSTVVVPCLIFGPPDGAGSVLKALRNSLYTQRGVRNVFDVVLHKPSQKARLRETGELPGEDEELCKICLLDPTLVPLDPVQAHHPGLTAAPLSFYNSSEAFRKGLVETNVLTSSIADKLEALFFSNTPTPSASPAAAAERNPTRPSPSRPRPTKPVLQGKFSLTTHTISLSYLNYTMPELLEKVLHEGHSTDAAVPLSGFEAVGHIAHLNLSDNHLPFRYLIGQVVLDCNPSIDVVVNKISSISSVFREFAMEIIGRRGAQWMPLELSDEERNELLLATVRQHGCTFRVPYNLVYWNSRLCHEHTRLVELMHPGDQLFDVMAGVGPFAIPAAQKGIQVFANDLNPHAAKYLSVNAALNRVQLSVFNLDGREFLKTVVYRHVMGHADESASPSSASSFTGRRHVVMNLPAIAVEFLDVFDLSQTESPWRCRCVEQHAVDHHVLIHVYCFSAAEDLREDAIRQVEQWLGFQLPPSHQEEVRMVRDVAPTKRMMCVSFTLPDAFWASQRPSNEKAEENERPCKIHRVE